MMNLKKSRFIATIIAVVVTTVMAVGCGLYVYMTANDMVLVSKKDYEKALDMREKYAKLYTLQKTIDQQFLWDVEEEAQEDAMCKAAIDALGDKYSYYMTKDEYETWSDFVTGIFTGIGIVFSMDPDGNFVINRVLEGGPAEDGGIKAGDYILKVDGKTFDDMNEVAMAVRGEEGTSVELTYQRGKTIKTVELVRAEVKEISVYGQVIEEDYGYIQITSFEAETAKQFETELKALENKGVKGLVIDLRNNPGGMMDQCIKIADMLLAEGMITYTEDKDGEKETYNSDEHRTKLEYVLLVNENSASASEIVAAAVKDNKGGPLVGEKTFGKGIIQASIPLEDGSAMSLTIMQYFSPNGTKIHENGVLPDHQVELPENAKSDKQLEKALELLPQ